MAHTDIPARDGRDCSLSKSRDALVTQAAQVLADKTIEVAPLPRWEEFSDEVVLSPYLDVTELTGHLI